MTATESVLAHQRRSFFKLGRVELVVGAGQYASVPSVVVQGGVGVWWPLSVVARALVQLQKPCHIPGSALAREEIR